MKYKYLIPVRIRRIFLEPAYFDKAGVRGVRRKFWKDIFFYVYGLLTYCALMPIYLKYMSGYTIGMDFQNPEFELDSFLIIFSFYLIFRMVSMVAKSGRLLAISNSRSVFVPGVSPNFERKKLHIFGQKGVYFNKACFVYYDIFRFKLFIFCSHSLLPDMSYKKVLDRT